MTKVAEFRDRSADQLSDELTKLKKEQFNLRFHRISTAASKPAEKSAKAPAKKKAAPAKAAPAKPAKKPAKRASAKT